MTSRAVIVLVCVLSATTAAAQPYLVRDINQGSDPHAGSEPQALTRAHGFAYFLAEVDGRVGLWRSDGTEAGTSAVADVLADNLVVAGDLLFFTAADEDLGLELWRSDGTPDGTYVVRDIRPGARQTFPFEPESPNPGRLTAVGDLVYFTADDGIHGHELWRSDGTEEGTWMVADIHPGAGSSITRFGPAFAALEDVVVLGAADGVHGLEPWRSDGTAEGTSLLIDIERGPASSLRSDAPFAGDRVVFFAASDETHGEELWRTDGTAEGTLLLADIEPGTASSEPTAPVRVGEVFYFSARDSEHGRELWTTDGSEAGTRLVADIDPGPGDSSPEDFVSLAGELFFTAAPFPNAHPRRLWRLDGEAAVSIQSRGTARFLTAVGDRLLFFGLAEDCPSELVCVAPDVVWASEGTPETTAPLALESATLRPSFVAPVVVDGHILFAADDRRTGTELWRTDGTPGGTRLVADINAPPGSSSPRELVAFDDRLYFSAVDFARLTAKSSRE